MKEADSTSCSVCNVYSLQRSSNLAKNMSAPLANVQDVIFMYWHLRKKLNPQGDAVVNSGFVISSLKAEV